MDIEIKNQIFDSYNTKKLIYENKEMLKTIEKVVKETIKCYQNMGKTLIAGNGGSAADAQHMAGEFVSRFYFDRPPLPSIALTTDTSILTAIGNDYGYADVFVRQLDAHGENGDIFFGISTSGNSENIVKALKCCQRKGIISVGLTGEKRGKMDDLCDYNIKVPSRVTPRIQEAHLLIEHIICCLVERELFQKEEDLCR